MFKSFICTVLWISVGIVLSCFAKLGRHSKEEDKCSILQQMTVVYFDQRFGAAHFKCFFNVFLRKKAEENGFKIEQKNYFLKLHHRLLALHLIVSQKESNGDRKLQFFGWDYNISALQNFAQNWECSLILTERVIKNELKEHTPLYEKDTE